MSEDPLAAIQPEAGGGEPPAPVASPEPAAPPAPEPPTPPADGGAEDGKLTEAEKREDDEWDKAADELFPGLKKTEDKKDEPAKSEKTAEEIAADEAAAKAKKSDGEPGAGDAADKGGEAAKSDGGDGDGEEEEIEPAEPTDATARLTAHEQQEAVEAVKNDIRDKMKIVTALVDGDGDPIKNIDDVMKLINPRTVGSEEHPKGRPFTEEEAGRFLLDAQRVIAENVKYVDQVADTNLNLKDQADVINYQYGELLKAMPELRTKLWAEYEKTLEKDSKSGIITKAKVSLQSFYEAALEPYAQMGRRLENEAVVKTEADTKAAEAAKAAAEEKKQKVRQDRSDIYGNGKVDTQTDEDKEWGAAALGVFGEDTLRSSGLIK